MEARKIEEYYTYADYVQWDDGNRYELIDGRAYMMAPAPTVAHQSINSNLHGQFYQHLKGKSCKVFFAPFDVRLHAKGDDDDTVVQPDLLIICDPSKIDSKGCNGAPDLVVEILSPSSVRHDTVCKFNQYLQAGVREYWIVDPYWKSVIVNVLDGNRYYNTIYDEKSTIPVHVLEDCKIDLSQVFEE